MYFLVADPCHSYCDTAALLVSARNSPPHNPPNLNPCWQSFSANGALEAAHYRAAGKQLLFSEQYMIDCGWEAENKGCYGGDQIRAFHWIFEKGGMASAESYPYIGINNFCRTDAELVKFTGQEQVYEHE